MQPVPGRPAGEIAEEAPPPSVDVLAPGSEGEPAGGDNAPQLAVAGEQGVERAQIGAVGGVGPSPQVGLDVGTEVVLELLGAGEGHAVERTVKPRAVEPVNLARHSQRDYAGQLRGVTRCGFEAAVEYVPCHGRPFRVS